MTFAFMINVLKNKSSIKCFLMICLVEGTLLYRLGSLMSFRTKQISIELCNTWNPLMSMQHTFIRRRCPNLPQKQTNYVIIACRLSLGEKLLEHLISKPSCHYTEFKRSEGRTLFISFVRFADGGTGTSQTTWLYLEHGLMTDISRNLFYLNKSFGKRVQSSDKPPRD